MSQLTKTLALASLVIVILIFSLILYRDQILLIVGNNLVVQDNLSPTDVIHVIAGEDYRALYAIHLYKQGYAKSLFFTGGWCNIHQYYNGQHGKELALALGVPEDAISFDDSPVTSTYAEAELLAAFIGSNPESIQSVTVVSDPYHMRRARWTYRRVLGNGIDILMAPVPFEETPYKQVWWLDRISQNYVREEYTKLLYYIVRYELSWGPIKEWLASLDRE